MENIADIFVIGGGINGTAIAADAAGRGLRVVLCEQGDLACETSSASTKLIHGGLRYLESFKFNLVKNALHECDVLMKRAPNLIRPLEFILPHEKNQRPFWMIRLGLFLYDHLAKRTLPRSHAINFQKTHRGDALLPEYKKGFSYYDCHTDDSRLVVLNALSAKEHGAEILTYTKFISAHHEDDLWNIHIQDFVTKKHSFYRAKALINVAGSWVKEVQKHIDSSDFNFELEHIKGSHIVIPKLYEGDFAYILQNSDERIVFTIPYQNDFTLIGTTDVKIEKNWEKAAISEEEKNYLCNVANQYFRKNISPAEIVWSYSGVRCLQGSDKKNPSKISREYKFMLDEKNIPPLLTVISGKLTIHRILAENAVNQLKPFFPNMGAAWTANAPLPGGDLKTKNFQDFYLQCKNDFSWLPENILQRYATSYGQRIYQLLANTKNISDLGETFAAGLYQKEIEYLMQHEWAKTSDDILWRRTKLGLYFSAGDAKKLNDWLLQKTT